MTTIPSIKLEWIDDKGIHRTDWIDGEWLHRLHRFDEKDHGKEMAGLLANHTCKLSEMPDGAAVLIDIMWPQFYAGSYLIQVRHHSSEDIPQTTLTKVLHSLGGKDTYIGRVAYLRSPEHRPPADLVELARAVPPDRVKDAYEKLTDRNGDQIGSGSVRAMWEHEQIMAIQDRYESGELIGRGWIVRSRITGEIGFLAAVTTDRDTLQTPDFGQGTRIILQLEKGIGDDGEDMLVCFVPAPAIQWAPAIANQLEAELKASAPTP